MPQNQNAFPFWPAPMDGLTDAGIYHIRQMSSIDKGVSKISYLKITGHT
jgi:hypothetical protein